MSGWIIPRDVKNNQEDFCEKMCPIKQAKRQQEQIGVVCDDAPFLPHCRNIRNVGNKCKTGSFSTTLSGGNLVLGSVWETENKQRPGKYFREIEVNNVTFELKRRDNTYSLDSFDALQDGQEFSVDVLETGAIARFSSLRQGSLCKSHI